MTTVQTRKPAFTLIEMSIVLVIIGLLMGLIFPIVTDFIKNEKKQDAKEYVEKVKNEILGYALINKRLPSDLDEIGVGEDPYGQTLVYTRPDGLTSGDICDNPTYTELTVVEEGTGGTLTTYEDIAFTLFSLGRNVLQEIDDTTVVDQITYYDPRRWGSNYATANQPDYDDIIEYVSMNYIKSKVCTNTASESFTPEGSDVSFGQNIADFTGQDTGIDPPGSASGAVTVNTSNNTVELGDEGDSGTDTVGCVWYQGDGGTTNTGCTDGNCDFDAGFRAFFTFSASPQDTSGDSSDQGYGFTFAAMDSAAGNTAASCGGGGPTGNTGNLGYAGVTPYTGIVPDKFGVEFDFTVDAGDEDASVNSVLNHVSTLYWGNDAAGYTEDNLHGSDLNPNPGAGHGQTDMPAPQEVVAFSGTADTITAGHLNYIISEVGAATKWEDGFEWSVRIEVERNTTATPQYVRQEVWVVYCGDSTNDCSNLSDLTIDFTAVAPASVTSADEYMDSKLYYTAPDDLAADFANYYFGWTTENKTGSQYVVSDFGVNFLGD